MLKPLDPDCLFKNGLHPSIKERLARVRELALGGVANLYGVERDPASGKAWLIWEYLPGRTFAERAADPARTPLALASAARELVLSVEAMHRLGIVHGAVRGSNVVVDDRGGVRITHVSPLLYTDPGVDVWGVLTTLSDAIEARAARDGEAGRDGELGRLVEEIRAWTDGEAGPAPAADAAFRTLAARLAGTIDAIKSAAATDGGTADGRTGPEQPQPREEPAADPRPGRRSLAAAALVLLVGCGVGLAVWWFVRRPVDATGGWVQSAWDAWR